MKFKNEIQTELLSSKTVLDQFLEDEKNLEQIEKAAALMVAAFKKGLKVISCGNGGSHCDAMHFAEELSGKFRDDREPFAAVAVSDASHITCTANDFGFDRIFSRFIKALGKKGDILLAISTSGNSQNIITAAEIARQRNMTVIGLTGNNGGKLAEFCDVEIRVPHSGYADRIQEMHIKIIHTLIYLIETMTTP
jgi:D-sedoheptulose 7-phosphate isomerase